jgi:hypothetical protein
MDFGSCADARGEVIGVFLECEVGKLGLEQTVEVGDTVEGECGNCHVSGKTKYIYVWYGGVVVDGEVSCGFNVYIGVAGGVVDDARRNAPWGRKA